MLIYKIVGLYKFLSLIFSVIIIGGLREYKFIMVF